MKSRLSNALFAFAALGLGTSAMAQNAPGSDPIVITGKVSFVPLPMAKPAPSKPLDPSTDLPPGLAAKVARFEAVAFSALGDGGGSVQTGNDVVTSQSGNALQKTCTTNVASNTLTPPTGGPVTPSGNPIGPAPNAMGPTGKYAPGANIDQVAVLRGDLVTICK